jgi:hypothetical protein
MTYFYLNAQNLYFSQDRLHHFGLTFRLKKKQLNNFKKINLNSFSELI